MDWIWISREEQSFSLARRRGTKQTSVDTRPCETDARGRKEARVSDASPQNPPILSLSVQTQPVRVGNHVFTCSAISASPAESGFQINAEPINTVATCLCRLLTSYLLVCECRGQGPNSRDNTEGGRMATGTLSDVQDLLPSCRNQDRGTSK